MKWLIIALLSFSLQAENISSEPISVYAFPDSYLTHPTGKPLRLGHRSRYATSSDIKWSPDGSYLASVNLLDHMLWFLKFDGREIQSISRCSIKGNGMKNPERVIFSPDGSLLAITGMKIITLYQVTATEPLAVSSDEADQIVHDGAFSPDGSYFACVTIGEPGRLNIYQIKESELRLVESRPISIKNIKPKALSFTSDNRFLVIAYGLNAGLSDPIMKGRVAVYHFNSANGNVGKKPVSMQVLNGSNEGIAIHPAQTAVYTTDQNGDCVYRMTFDPLSGTLGTPAIVLQNPGAQLSFPHGLSFSPDGQYLGVSNYGDDKLTIYRVTP